MISKAQRKNFDKKIKAKLIDLRLSDEQIDEVLARMNLVALDINQMVQVDLLVDQARWSTRVAEARAGLILDWLWAVLYGAVTDDEKERIDVHLKELEHEYSRFMGTDASSSERHSYKLLCELKVIEITRINPGFGKSIKIQLE